MPLALILHLPGTYMIDDDGIRGNNISLIRDASRRRVRHLRPSAPTR